ncbi:MAG: hypothetical protein QM831_24360 [Kofleriaceae bacterium]
MRTLVVMLALAGCTAAFKTQTGGAIAPTGVASGTTNSVYIGDRGGLLTRAALVAVGLVAAAGSVDSKTTTTVTDNGTYYTVHQETTSTVNQAQAQNAVDIMHKAGDSDLAERTERSFSGLSAGLEIADRDLGGDTGGWMFDFGYIASGPIADDSAWGARAYVKLGFGSMTMHDRMMQAWTTSALESRMGDADYGFFGLLTRGGLNYSFTKFAKLEAFIELNLNMLTLLDPGETNSFEDMSHPSPWWGGSRFTLAKYFYVEGKVGMSAMNTEHTSVAMEAGFEF